MKYFIRLLIFSLCFSFVAGSALADFKKNKIIDDNEYSVALNLAPMTPKWLESLGGKPMKLGLDLRGGVRFLMEVDVASSFSRRLEGLYGDLRNGLREEKIKYIINPETTMIPIIKQILSNCSKCKLLIFRSFSSVFLGISFIIFKPSNCFL